jgi:hypothetical protein
MSLEETARQAIAKLLLQERWGVPTSAKSSSRRARDPTSRTPLVRIERRATPLVALRVRKTAPRRASIRERFSL